MKSFGKLFLFVAGCELVGLLGTPFTIGAIPAWYRFLNKPVFSPPNWIFGPVWTILYFLMGISAYLIYTKGIKNKKVRLALAVFALQLFFNFVWSLVFFGLRQPLLAFFDIVCLWVSLLYVTYLFRKVSTTAAYLLIPYIIWVSFASVLNLAIVILNP